MESPVIVENCANFAMPVDRDETGFPFEDDCSFQDSLNNIAQRHPELADQLRFGDFPSLRRKRNGSGSSDQDNSRFGGVGSSRFGIFNNRFPFSSHFEDEFANTPAQNRQEKPPEVPKSQEKRGRKPNPNLPQHLSNTVDLGQKQPPVEEVRSQRSMSAPPENRSTQSSRVENEASEDQNMGKSQSRPTEQPTAPSQAKERIIPIHVEGRSEPVLPKNTHTPHHANSGPQPEKVFGQEAFFKGTDPYTKRQQAYDHFMPRQQTPPYQQYHQQPPQQQQQQHHHHHQQQQQPHFQQAPPQHHKQATPPPENRPNQQQQPPQQAHQQQQQQQQQQRATPPPSNDPLDKIKIVKNDVLDLMTDVQNFKGTRKDKEYMYLDEMLTRNLIKLDDIDTDGKDNIRSARKEAIKCIQTCINNLEAKAQAREKEIKAAEEQQKGAADQNQGAEGGAANQTQSEAQNQNSQEQQSVCPPTFKTEATINLSAPAGEEQPSSGQEQQMEVEKQKQESSEKSTAANDGGAMQMEVDTNEQPESVQSNSSQPETTSK